MSTATELAQQHWNKTPLYFSEEARYRIYPWLCDAAEFTQHAGERVLEVGCGTGSDLLQFAKNGALATGVDITERHIDLARQRVGNMATVIKADGRDLPFADESFDYVYSHGVLHHIAQPRRAVEEIFRVLRPGGRFNVHLYARYSYFLLPKVLRHPRNWKLYVENSTDPVHIDLYTARKCRALFSPYKLKISKHQCEPFEWMAPLLGWFLIVKGRK